MLNKHSEITRISQLIVNLTENIQILRISIQDAQNQNEETLKTLFEGVDETLIKLKFQEEIEYLEGLLKNRMRELSDAQNSFIDLAKESNLDPIIKHEFLLVSGAYVQIWYDTFGNVYYQGPYSKN